MGWPGGAGVGGGRYGGTRLLPTRGSCSGRLSPQPLYFSFWSFIRPHPLFRFLLPLSMPRACEWYWGHTHSVSTRISAGCGLPSFHRVTASTVRTAPRGRGWTRRLERRGQCQPGYSSRGRACSRPGIRPHRPRAQGREHSAFIQPAPHGARSFPGPRDTGQFMAAPVWWIKISKSMIGTRCIGN